MGEYYGLTKHSQICRQSVKFDDRCRARWGRPWYIWLYAILDEIEARNRGELWKDAILRFGKYQGHTIAEVLSINPGYLLWLKENVSRITLAQPIIDEAIEASKRTRKVRCIYDPFGYLSDSSEDIDDDDDHSDYIGLDDSDFGNN